MREDDLDSSKRNSPTLVLILSLLSRLLQLGLGDLRSLLISRILDYRYDIATSHNARPLSILVLATPGIAA
jgi:hypothetical protein